MAAIDAIRDEMARTRDKPAEMLGELITLLLPRHPEWEEALSAKGKNLKGAFAAIYDAAKKAKQNAMTDAEALHYALEYYGIQADAMWLSAELEAARGEGTGTEGTGNREQGTGRAGEPAAPVAPAAPAEQPQAPAGMDLDDLLEGL